VWKHLEGTITTQFDFTARKSHYTKYYKLVIFIVDMIFIPFLACSNCSNFEVAADDWKRNIGETK
jgi:hypothetical protein